MRLNDSTRDSIKQEIVLRNSCGCHVEMKYILKLQHVRSIKKKTQNRFVCSVNDDGGNVTIELE